MFSFLGLRVPTLEEFWDMCWENQCLLMNLASQIDVGVVSDALRRDFLDKLKALASSPATGSDLWSFLRSLPNLAGPEITPDREIRVIRVAPMRALLEHLTLTNEKGEPDIQRTEDAKGALRELSKLRYPDHRDPDRGPALEALRRQERSVRAKLRPRNLQLQPTLSLPVAMQDAVVAPAVLTKDSIALKMREASTETVFLAPLVEACDLPARLSAARTEEFGGQRIRDMLGLDHLGHVWNASLTVLGFIAFALDTSVYRAYRPTVFDETSLGRFMGRYGARNGTRGAYGRTADLSAILTPNASLVGAREFVTENKTFSNFPVRLTVGYLGILHPDSKAYDDVNSGADASDTAFLDAIRCGRDRSEILGKIGNATA